MLIPLDFTLGVLDFVPNMAGWTLLMSSAWTEVNLPIVLSTENRYSLVLFVHGNIGIPQKSSKHKQPMAKTLICGPQP